MTPGVTRTAAQSYARIGGMLYLFIVVVGIFGELIVRGRLTSNGDPAATAANITAAETLFRVGVATDLLGYIASIAVAVILYGLLQPVSRTLALLTLLLTITSTAIFGLNALFHIHR